MKYNFLLIFVITILCTACGSKADNNAVTIITVKPEVHTNTLYFNGIIEPLNTYSIVAIADGVVVQKYFDYGEPIKKNQLLLVINSQQLDDNYQDALTTYIKAKKDYDDNQLKAQGTEELNRLGIISRDDYLSSKSQAENIKLSLLQTRRKLQNLLANINNPDINLNTLEKDNNVIMNKWLSMHVNSLRILSPSDGIALLPNKTDNSDQSNADIRLTVGSQIKASQVLLTVGDITGITLTVKINELHINEIKLGQKAVITSDAFEDTLNGTVTHLDQQATPDSSGNAPAFAIKITVPSITPLQRKIIHVGMSAKVALTISKPAIIKLPLNAVFNDNGKTWVKSVDKMSGKIKTVPVITGGTTLDSVVIQQGVKAGDEVMLNVAH